MAWSAPFTAVANTAYTAAQHNQYVRDNLNMTAPALATTVGSIFTGNGVNAIAERIPAGAIVLTSQSTTSTSYTDLLTSGPAITMVTGTSALIFFSAAMQHNTADIATWMSVAVSGATTVGASDTWGIANPSRLTDSRPGTMHRFSGLTPGSNTFTAKYRVPSGTGFFGNREIFGIPL